MIKTEDLTKRFSKVLALDHISFNAQPGEVFGLLGPNGAGKTTTIRLILSIIPPTEGRIWVDGIDVIREPDRARARIGAVLEENGVYDRLTALENVEFFGRLYGLSKEVLKERIERLFSLLEMEEFAHRKSGTLSKGMKQKIALARALIADSPILLLDEPTAGLDVPTKRIIINLIKKEKEKGKCILYSTHIMSEAEEVCDRIAIIHKGRIRGIGTLRELRDKTGKEKLEDVFLSLVGKEWE